MTDNENDATRTQTVSSRTEIDALRNAERIAENIRADGNIVTVGRPYMDLSQRKYGWTAIDLTVSPATPTVTEEEPTTVVATDDASPDASEEQVEPTPTPTPTPTPEPALPKPAKKAAEKPTPKSTKAAKE